MRYCWNCGSEIGDDEKFCSRCGAKADGPDQTTPQPERETPSYSSNNTYYSQSAGPKKDNSKKIIIGILAVTVVLILIVAFVLPSFVTVEQTADYNVEMTITNVSISDAEMGFSHSTCKDTSGRMHAYLVYACNGSAETYHELGWCSLDGTKMAINPGQEKVSFGVYGKESDITMSVFLVVVTNVVNGANHYDYIDLYDVTKYIQGDKPTGYHNYGATGVTFKLTDLNNCQANLSGDSGPKGTITLTFVVTKK